jgi:protein-tyrosine phosphatase
MISPGFYFRPSSSSTPPDGNVSPSKNKDTSAPEQKSNASAEAELEMEPVFEPEEIAWGNHVKNMLECTTALYDLSQIEPNSSVHKDRTGRFINTAHGYQSLQSLANWWKGGSHTPEKLAKDINQFRVTFNKATRDIMIPYSGIDNSTILRLVHIRLKEAIGDEKHGLIALEKTYENDPKVKMAVQKLMEELNDWENQIQRSQPEGEFQPEILEEESQQMSAEDIGWKKYLCNYSAALYYNHIQCLSGRWNWQDKIGDFEKGKLYLGVLPSQSPWQDSLAFMKNEGIKAVLSITEVFENKSAGYLLSPIPPQVFGKEGIAQTQITAQDFGTLSLEKVEQGVEYIHSKLATGESVYVHCKAGRGRSALVIMCYLIKYQGKTADEAFALVKSQRKQAGFSQKDPKWQTLKEFEKMYTGNRQT